MSLTIFSTMCSALYKNRNSPLFHNFHCLSLFSEAPLYPSINMAEIPSNTQRPHSFHPEFDREVYMIVFSVGVFIFLDQ